MYLSIEKTGHLEKDALFEKVDLRDEKGDGAVDQEKSKYGVDHFCMVGKQLLKGRAETCPRQCGEKTDESQKQ